MSIPLPNTASAAILEHLNSPLIIDTIELPKKLDVGQVLVKVLTSGICGSQLGEIAGVKGEDQYLPHLLGHEGCGIVLAIGPGVKHVAINDTVVMHWRKGAGIDASPAIYLWRGKILNSGSITTFNNFSVVSENRLSTIPKTFNIELAPLLGCAVTTGFGVISNDAQLKMGESIAVFGAGGVGLNIIQAAAMSSAYPIIAIDLYPEKLLLAKKLGATHVINAQQDNVEEQITSILNNASLDVAIDNTGDTDIIQSCYQLTSKTGRIILVGVPRHDRNISLHSLALHFGKKLIGSHGGQSEPNKDIPRLIKLYNAGLLSLSELVTHHYSLENINTAINKMREGSVQGRCIIHFEHANLN